MNIALLAGGHSPERTISMKSSLAIYDSLSKQHDVTIVDPALGAECIVTREYLVEQAAANVQSETKDPATMFESITPQRMRQFDCVFIGLHGLYGEDGYVQGILDLIGVPYTGSSMLASACAMSKDVTKRMLASANVLTPMWFPISSSKVEDHELLHEVITDLGRHLVVKPDNQGSSVGVSILENTDVHELEEACRLAAQFGELILVEQLIPGREIAVGILNDEPLSIVEIIPHEGWYDYEHKYTSGKTEYVCPAEFDEFLTEFIQGQAHTAHSVLKCTGYSRVDFLVDGEGRAWVLEVNPLPGMTENSLMPKSAAASGISFDELCQSLIEEAVKN